MQLICGKTLFSARQSHNGTSAEEIHGLPGYCQGQQSSLSFSDGSDPQDCHVSIYFSHTQVSLALEAVDLTMLTFPG